MTPRPRVTIYTDGGSDPNPGPGGWAALLIAENGITKEISGTEADTTNNRMELTAAIEALRALRHSSAVTLFTDSRYLQQGISEWLPGWIKRGWRRADKQPVLNEDLWRALHAETQRHDIRWQWVRGHAGNVYNERVDQLVRAARRAQHDGTPLPEPGRLQAVSTAAAPDVVVALRVSMAPRGGVGGWAARVADTAGGSSQVHSGRLDAGTSNRLLLAAALEALRRTAPGTSIRIYCPDTYLCDGMTKWIRGWQQRGWRTKDNTEVKHRDLWESLLAEGARRHVQWAAEPGGLTLAQGLAELAAQASAGA